MNSCTLRTVTRPLRLPGIALLLLTLQGTPGLSSRLTAAEAATKSWSGTWDNKKFKTNGPLTCRATQKDATTWEAKFTGEGLGKPFAYDATIKSADRNGRLVMGGTATVDGETYQWSGYVQGKFLLGSYRSATGNNGSFKLQEAK